MQRAIFLGVLLAVSLMLSTTWAADVSGRVPDVMSIAGARAKATPPGRETSAVYLTILNNSDTEDIFVGATTPVAEKVEIRDSAKKNMVLSSVPLKRSDALVFKPGSIHLLLSGLKRQLLPQDKFPMTFNFAKADKVTVHVMVVAPNAEVPPEPGEGRWK